MTKIRLPALAAACLGLLLLGTSCKTQLAPGGAYSDATVFKLDQTAKTSYEALSVFLRWEKANRAVLPAAVQSAAKNIRDKAPQAFKSYVAVSDAYKLAPAATGEAALDKALAVLTAMVSEAALWLPTSATSPTPTK